MRRRDEGYRVHHRARRGRQDSPTPQTARRGGEGSRAAGARGAQSGVVMLGRVILVQG